MRPVGDAGVSTISSAAGKKARSSSSQRVLVRRYATAPLNDFMDTGLHTVKLGVRPAQPDQLVVSSILDQPAPIERDDAVRAPHCRQAVCDDEHRAAPRDVLHVVLNNTLALVIERAGRLIEDQDARIGDERAGDRNALALAA